MTTNNQKTNKKINLPLFGSVVSAILASICCLGPIILAILGLGGAGLFSQFAEFRPYLIGITVIFLGLAFYLTYRKRKVKCEDGTCRIQKAPKWNKIVLWLATVFIILFLAFPYLIGSIKTNTETAQVNGKITSIIIRVEGMTCSGCEFNVENAIKKLKGIIEVKADHKKGEVSVKFEKDKIQINDLMTAINKAGYKAINH